MTLKPRPWWAGVAIAIWALATAWGLVLEPRREVVDAIPDTLRALLAALVLFGLTGYGVTQLLLPASLRRHALLWVLPTGACVSGLALMVLGFAAVPFPVSLVVVLLAGAGLSVRARGAVTVGRTVGWPVFLALVVIGLAIAPMVMELHFETVTGTG